MKIVQVPYEDMKTTFENKNELFLIAVRHDFGLFEKLQDPEVLRSKTSGS